MLFQPMSDYPLCLPISFTIGLKKIRLSVALRTLCTQSKKQNCFTYFRIADRISNILPDLHPGNLFPLSYIVNYFYCYLPFPRIFYFLAQVNSDRFEFEPSICFDFLKIEDLRDPPQCVELKLRWRFCGHTSTCPEIYF